ncbi:cyclophilin-like fold protein [Nocardioides sp. Soil805]|uniref:cyclophilin-like fold protein n=1 Tax=Nocardioides sp. Soil805 TaxID=1736416 RepID=UPI00138ED948|nr:cyclophilin-like fold protein [Nocardioides sp. Soil805]
MRRRLTSLAAAAALLTACAASEGGSGRSGRGSTPSASPSKPSRTSATEAPARVEIVAGGVELTAVLRDTAATRDLLAQLPLTVTMRDHGGVERTGPLPARLSTADAPAGADPDVADLGYYAPGGDLVLYYGDQSYFDGIVVLGRLDGDVGALAGLTGDVVVEVRRLTAGGPGRDARAGGGSRPRVGRRG